MQLPTLSSEKKINVLIHPRTSYKNIFITQNQKFKAFKL